jgi:hypothetical protein
LLIRSYYFFSNNFTLTKNPSFEHASQQLVVVGQVSLVGEILLVYIKDTYKYEKIITPTGEIK